MREGGRDGAHVFDALHGDDRSEEHEHTRGVCVFGRARRKKGPRRRGVWISQWISLSHRAGFQLQRACRLGLAEETEKCNRAVKV